MTVCLNCNELDIPITLTIIVWIIEYLCRWSGILKCVRQTDSIMTGFITSPFLENKTLSLLWS